MMIVTHALFGAALSRLAPHPLSSFLVGVASHALGDVLPHRERPLKMDAPIAAAALALLAWRYGLKSSELCGALGGISPDSEHLPTVLGWQTPEKEQFPTHGPYPQRWLHSLGRTPTDDRVQIGLVIAALLLLCTKRDDEC